MNKGRMVQEMRGEGRGSSDVMSKLKQICKDSEKFEKKIGGKEFLLGKYFDGKKANKLQKTKKYTKSKVEQLLAIQEQMSSQAKNYSFYQPLNTYWKNYIRDLLKDDKIDDAIYLKLLRADFHGAHITVVHSRVDSYIGIQGTVISETLKTFRIVIPSNRILTLIKSQLIFQLEIEGKFYVVNGNCLIYRSIDRTKVKFKNKKAEPINNRFLTGFIPGNDPLQ